MNIKNHFQNHVYVHSGPTAKQQSSSDASTSSAVEKTSSSTASASIHHNEDYSSSRRLSGTILMKVENDSHSSNLSPLDSSLSLLVTDGELTPTNGCGGEIKSHSNVPQILCSASSVSDSFDVKDESQSPVQAKITKSPYRSSRSLRSESMSSTKETPMTKSSLLSPPIAKNIRVSAVREPPRLPELIHTDVLMKEMKWMQNCFIDEHKQKTKLFKYIAQNSVKFLTGRESRLQKQKEDEEKRLRMTARSVALNIREFWKVVETVVSQKCQTKLKGELREEKEAKQAELVAEATTFAESISKGLKSWEDGFDPLMIRIKETEKFLLKKGRVAVTKKQESDAAEERVETTPLASPVDAWSQGWSEQEEEDAEFDEALSDDDSNGIIEDSEDELTALQNEMEMDISQLMEKFHVNDAMSVQLPSPLGSGTSSTRSKRDRTPEAFSSVSGESGEIKSDSEIRIMKRQRISQDTTERFRQSSANGDETDCGFESSPALQSSDVMIDASSDGEIPQSPRRLPRRGMRHHPSGSSAQDPPSPIPEVDTIPSRRSTKTPRRSRQREVANEVNDKAEESASDMDVVPGMCPIPFLLRAKLRTYQHQGLTWLLTLHDSMANGILADEMGLGKTIQTIALLAYLACYRGVWGPHLVVAPSSVLLNWETEFKRFLPGFKVLTYYGGKKEREKKRQGWNEPFAFHVCIVSYTLIVADAHVFRRKAWYYMVLDEAQNIKNFKTQKWQTMLNFNSQRRLLLTGTPLQNDLLELWALMHFLMPDLFESHSDWKELFSDPLIRAIESDSVERERDLVGRLHSILRPFLLRRLKREVEGQMPSKYEHVVRCNLTKRQRALYDEFIENKATKATMESSDYFGLLNILMQLRKVCNHPDLLAPREISTPFGDESLIRPSLTLPSCTFLSLNEPWAMTKDQIWNRLSNESELLTIATCEVRGTSNIESSRNRLYSSPLIEEIKKKNRKELEDSARGISRFPLIRVISESKISDSQTTSVGSQIPISSPPTSRRLRRERTSLSHVEAPSVTHSQSDIKKTQLSDCLSCDIVREILLTPVGEQTSIGPKTEQGTQDHHPSDRLIRDSLDSINERSPKRRKLDDVTSCDATPSTIDREFLDFPSEKFREKLFRVIQQSFTPSFSSLPFSQFSTIYGYPPKLSDVIIQGIIKSKTTFFDEQSPCFHLYSRTPFDATCVSSLAQLPTLASLSSSSCLATATCPILEPLCQQTARRYPNRQWLQRARNSLRMACSQTAITPPPNGSNINLYRKVLFEQAAKHNADPKGIVPIEKALAAQWVHVTASSVGVIRRSVNLEYLVNHPPGDDDPYLRLVGSSPEFEFCCHNDSGMPIVPPTRCFFGPRLRAFFQRHVWRNYPRCLSILRGTAEEERGITALERYFLTSPTLEDLCPIPEEAMKKQMQKLRRAICIHEQKIRPLGPTINLRGRFGRQTMEALTNGIEDVSTTIVQAADVFHPVTLAQLCLFPPRRALEEDCGKLIILGRLLHKLKSEGHKCILFTQMSKMLDIIEGFINLHGFTYLRLDGSTKVEHRQRIVETFNTDTRIFIFMASTRAGGVGINLIGADTVIFYDTDWNPAMDRQAMDRCHRIGQTRDVHIYRLITEHSIEENILRKQLMKRMLDDVVVDQGKFTTQKISDLLDKSNVKEMFQTSLDTSDLYVTRVLHETKLDLTPLPTRTPSTSAESSVAAFEAAIARIEDSDDQLALEQTSLENSMEIVEFEKEFDEHCGDGQSGEARSGVTPIQASLAVLSIGNKGRGQITPTKETDEKVEEVPFWAVIKESTSETPRSFGRSKIRNEVSMDGYTTFYVSNIVKYAIDFTEENLTGSILNEIAALQNRLHYFRASYQQAQPSPFGSKAATCSDREENQDDNLDTIEC